MKTLKLLLILSALTFAVAYQTQAVIINIPADFPNIQAGINAAVDGDTVLVQPGTYMENINFNGKNITVGSLFLTTQDETYISQTIIDGDQNGSVVKFVSGEGLNSVITGFTIINGFANYNDPIPGGAGIKCVNSSPTIENNIIKENNCELYVYGGGIYCEESSSHILNNAICYNVGAYAGAGIFISDTSAVLIKGNIIHDNVTASGYGVASGGGIFCWGNECYCIIENNTICNNIVDFGEGGGIYSNTLNTCVVNTIVWNNSPDEIAETLTITYSDIQGGWAGTGNIDADPLFADPANGDYHITWANFPIPDETKSPCIDAGDPSSPYDPDETIADIGAFYFNQSQVTQQIDLPIGYSFVSSRIVPENPDMLIVMAPVLNENLDFVRNSLGQTLRKIGPNWINGIGDWIVDEGYLVKMFVDDSFTIIGYLVDPTTPIFVVTGFNFVSYFPENPMDALDAFATIIGDDLDFVRNSQGQTLRKIGPNWVNGIGDCQPGEGYLVKMFVDGVLIYPGSPSFTCGDTFTDPRNGQTYNTVLIGDQCWMAENLNIGEMINGTEEMTNNGVIEKYCYNNNSANCDEYGGLYQWHEMNQYVADTATQGICPEGWYLPTDFEWKILEGTVDSQYPVGDPIWNNLGYRGFDVGLNLKSTSGWYSSGNGSGLYGFEALPGGYRSSNGIFDYLTNYAYFWSSQTDINHAWDRYLYYNCDNVSRDYSYKAYGFSVRCLKDNSNFTNLSNRKDKKFTEPKTKNIETVHFIFEGGNPAEAVYTIYIKGLKIGDEVAVFDGDKIIGSVKINSQNAFENELPVFSTLINGQGYEEGNPIILKVWSENKIVLTEFAMEAIYDSYVSDVYPEGDGKYSVVNITKGEIENVKESISIFPNPSKGIFNISLEGVKGDIQIMVFDLRGKEYSNFELSGSASTQLDLTDLPAGVYFISISGKDFSEVRKIVIK